MHSVWCSSCSRGSSLSWGCHLMGGVLVEQARRRRIVRVGETGNGLTESLQLHAAFCVFLVVTAVIALIGVVILQGYDAAVSDPDIWIEP